MSDESQLRSQTRYRWKLAFALLVAAAIVCWILLCFRVRFAGSRLIPIYAYFSLLNFLSSLLGFWVGFGRWRWRIPVAGAGSFLIGAISDFAFGGNSFWEFETYAVGVFCVVAVTTLVLRIGKGTLRPLNAVVVGRSNVLQFGIKRVMIWTAAIAIAHVLGKLLLDFAERYAGTRFSTDVLAMIASLSVCVSIATVASVWALLEIQISVARTVILVLAIVAATFCIYAFYDNGLFFAVSAGVSQLLMAIAMMMLRMQGLRFVKAAAPVQVEA